MTWFKDTPQASRRCPMALLRDSPDLQRMFEIRNGLDGRISPADREKLSTVTSRALAIIEAGVAHRHQAELAAIKKGAK